MKFKESTELKTLAKAAELSIAEFTNVVISELIKADAIEDDELFWGKTVHDSIDDSLQVRILVNVLYKSGIQYVTNRHFEALLNLVLIGESDCPKCGGEMEVYNGKYKRAFGDGYMTPFEFEPEWEDRRCMHCGHVQIGTRYNEE